MPNQPSTAQIKAEVMRLRKIRRRMDMEQAALLKAKKAMLIRGKREAEVRRDLTQELVDLKNPKSAAFRRNVKRAGRLGLRAILLIGEDIDRRLRSKRRKK